MSKHIKTILFFLLLLLAAASQAQEIKTWKLADLRKAVNETKGPTIFNFWATFCIPCLKELPYFDALSKKYAADGVRLVLVSLDMKEAYPKKIKDMLKRKKISAGTVFLNETNADLFCPAVDSSWSGAIPATLMVNPKTGFRKFFEEEMSKDKLERNIREMLGRQ